MFLKLIPQNKFSEDIRISESERDGAEICRDFKMSYPQDNIPVILISAEHNLSLIARYCGADAFMRKPFKIFKLLG